MTIFNIFFMGVVILLYFIHTKQNTSFLFRNFMVQLCGFSFQKNLAKGRTKIFFVKKYGFIVCKRSALKKLNQCKKIEIPTK